MMLIKRKMLKKEIGKKHHSIYNVSEFTPDAGLAEFHCNFAVHLFV